MKFDILTIFPNIFDSYISESMLKIARDKKVIEIKTRDIRSAAADKHRTVDDKPYGGGPGMLMMADPIYKTLKKIKREKRSKVILMAPGGKMFDQKTARRYSKLDQLIFICGRYEGMDARIEKFIDEKVSIGPYVLCGGELPAMVITEAVTRLLPGALGHELSAEEESHSQEGYIEYPQYTRPEIWSPEGHKYRVPKVLLSGHHAEIEKWRSAKAGGSSA